VHKDSSLELFYNHLRDGEAQPHAALVDALGLGDLAEKPEKLVKILLLDS
jgi:hypothetical protein